jgi:hypothetical protein
MTPNENHWRSWDIRCLSAWPVKPKVGKFWNTPKLQPADYRAHQESVGGCVECPPTTKEWKEIKRRLQIAAPVAPGNLLNEMLIWQWFSKLFISHFGNFYYICNKLTIESNC